MKYKDCPYGYEDFEKYKTYIDEEDIENCIWCDKVGEKVYSFGHCNDWYEQDKEKYKNHSKKKRINKRERYLKHQNHLKYLYETVGGYYPTPARYVDEIWIKGVGYIKNPKPSGYRSLHLIVRVPIFLQNEKCFMKVEVQLRTIAMDFWASLEHKLRYKKEIPEFEKDSLQKELFECAQMINTLDQRMEAVKNRLAAGGQWEKS